MVDRAAKSVFYDVLAVGNAESVILLPDVADPPPAPNSSRYSDVKFKVVSVNINGSGGRNGNGRCGGGGGGGGGGRGSLKEDKDGDNGGGGAKRCGQQQRQYYDAVSPAMF